MKSPISNDFIKFSADVHTEIQVVPKPFLIVSVRELHNSMTGPLEEGGLKEARYEQNNIIISDSMLRNFLLPQLKNISVCQRFICGCECCGYIPRV